MFLWSALWVQPVHLTTLNNVKWLMQYFLFKTLPLWDHCRQKFGAPLGQHRVYLPLWNVINLNQLSVLTEVISTKPNFNYCALFLGVHSSKAVKKSILFTMRQHFNALSPPQQLKRGADVWPHWSRRLVLGGVVTDGGADWGWSSGAALPCVSASQGQLLEWTVSPSGLCWTI